jgi:N-methylhydantoinase A/oxoprolinase/acetone carboxylase beta subunit
MAADVSSADYNHCLRLPFLLDGNNVTQNPDSGVRSAAGLAIRANVEQLSRSIV